MIGGSSLRLKNILKRKILSQLKFFSIEKSNLLIFNIKNLNRVIFLLLTYIKSLISIRYNMFSLLITPFSTLMAKSPTLFHINGRSPDRSKSFHECPWPLLMVTSRRILRPFRTLSLVTVERSKQNNTKMKKIRNCKQNYNVFGV